LIISDFRQNYEPEQATIARHWLVDHDVGRELLATQLRVMRPDLNVPMMLGPNKHFDAEMNLVVPTLGLEGMKKPDSAWEDIKTSWVFLKRIAVLEFAEVKKAFVSFKGRGYRQAS